MTAQTEEPVREGQILAGPQFNEPMRVVTVGSARAGLRSLGLVGQQTRQFQFETVLVEITPHEMRRARDNLDALHEFVRLRSKPYDRRGTAYRRAPKSDARGY